ncbi:hypothetical protein [Nonomuraea sp. NEAU-A123]|uniref:hypothetical protein n=1 Tax=Nonomuraea sp. NEAU-A123 TaxID=2839649 RepID=UPI001BE46BDF|nr:hypothetical protein [Nonomuraea sp. NEAU-A123]MBT2235499.1 hypothetical protein [Nonomuraea sp. NEAU-A123]
MRHLYGHLRTTLVSEGYASRSRGGVHELIDVETVRAVADTVAELRDGLDAGERISGPAARRVIKAAARATGFEGTTINATTARKLIANEDVMIPDVEVRLRETITKLKKTIANKNKELAQIRGDVPALVRAVHQLTLENQELRAQLELPSPNVTPLHRRR